MSSLAVAMTTTEARQVTSRIKLLVETIAANTEKVVSLIEQAESGKAWQVLGYESWPAYVAAEFSGALAGLGKAERIPITAKLSATGMSTRAISAVTETSVGTVHSDVVAAGVQDLNTSQNVVGLDGKTYVRNGRATSRGMLEMADGVPAPTPKRRARPLPDQYRDAVEDLEKSIEKMVRLTEDDRFGRHHDHLADRYGDRLDRARQRLHYAALMPLVSGGDR